MFRFFGRKAAALRSKLPEPHQPNGEVKEAERHQSMALETIQSCINKTRESKRSTQRMSRSLGSLLPVATKK